MREFPMFLHFANDCECCGMVLPRDVPIQVSLILSKEPTVTLQSLIFALRNIASLFSSNSTLHELPLKKHSGKSNKQ